MPHSPLLRRRWRNLAHSNAEEPRRRGHLQRQALPEQNRFELRRKFYVVFKVSTRPGQRCAGGELFDYHVICLQKSTLR